MYGYISGFQLKETLFNEMCILRNSDRLEITNPRIELFKKSPIYSLQKLWNELDTRFHQCKTIFSISIKDKLLDDPTFLQ
jgi:hypothetical protein